MCQFLEDSKAENVVAVDLQGKSDIADFLVVADGRSQRHIKMIGEKLKHHLHTLGIKTIPIEGLNQCDWVLVDAGDVIIHLFRPEIRELYNLEKMWGLDFKAPSPSSEHLAKA